MVMTRHEFLAALHRILKPAVYLEIGVQLGTSLRLAQPGTWAVGVDPYPLTAAPANGEIYPITSDEFFAQNPEAFGHFLGPLVDLAFIDGMHLFEYALRDFMGVERYSRPGSVVAFDDVLPRNQGEADRVQCPGDWTGDVWRVHPYLRSHRPDLDLMLVDTHPTGVLVVRGLDPTSRVLMERYRRDDTARALTTATTVPEVVLTRGEAIGPGEALQRIEEGLA